MTMKNMKIRPTQICPLCNSGKKFKNCCRNIQKNKKLKPQQNDPDKIPPVVKRVFELKQAETS